MLTETDILEALKVCYDPELQINIVDLGRVHAIHVDVDDDSPGQRQRVTVELLPRSEEHDSMLAAQIINRLLGLRELSRAETTLLDSPSWTPDRMTASARTQRSVQQGLVQLG